MRIYRVRWPSDNPTEQNQEWFATKAEADRSAKASNGSLRVLHVEPKAADLAAFLNEWAWRS